MTISKNKAADKAAKAAAAKAAAERAAGINAKLTEAGAAAASMFALTREAAQMAAVELDVAKPVKDRVAAVLTAYADALKDAGHNVKAIFSDCLMLAAAGQQGVNVTITTKDATGAHEQSVPAQDAILQPKHGLRAAASEARDLLGLGRGAGGGRKPRPSISNGPAMEPAPDMVAQALTAPTAQQVFEQCMDALSEYLADATFHPQVAAHLLETGWKLTRAAKAKA